MNAISPIAGLERDKTERVALPSAYLEQRWYAAYTSANHEKRVAEQLGVRAVEHFLPVNESERRWKDRRVRLQMPLFPGYVFVRLALPEEEIEALKAGLADGVCAEPHPYLTTGRRARVKTGPLAGLEGILVRRKNRTRFIISLDLILRSVAVEVDVADLYPV